MKVETIVAFEHAEIVTLLTEKAREATNIKSGGAKVTCDGDAISPSYTVHLSTTEPKKR